MATIDEVKVAITADTKGLEKGVDDSKKKLVELGASNFSLKDSFATLRDTMQGPIAAFKEIASVASDLINQFSEDELASIRMNKAIENSRLISSDASKRFEDMAASLQRVTIYGDDVTKSQVAQLAAMGRTESQIKRIISVAMDLASATGDDLSAAVQKVNQALSGNAMQLARTNPAIRALTDEEIKNGKAVDVLERQYKGFAETIGSSTAGAVAKAKNYWGDLQEWAGGVLATMLGGLTSFAEQAGKALKAFFSGPSTEEKLLSKATELSKAIESGSISYGRAKRAMQEYAVEIKATKGELADFAETFKKGESKLAEFAFGSFSDVWAEIIKARKEYNALKEQEAKDAEARAKSDRGDEILAGVKSQIKFEEELADAYRRSGVEYDLKAKKIEIIKAALEAVRSEGIYIEKDGKIVGETLTELLALMDALTKKGKESVEAIIDYLEEEDLAYRKTYGEIMDLLGRATEGEAELEGQYDSTREAAFGAAKEAQEGLADVGQAARDAQNDVDNLGSAFQSLGDYALQALQGGVTDLFHAMDVAGSNMGDIWGAAAQSFEEFMVRFIDNLPALLLQAGLQLIGVGQWPIGLAMIAAAGGVALVDALTTSDAEQRVYGTGKYSKPEAAPTTGATTPSTITSSPSEDMGSASGLSGGTTVNIYGVRDTSPAALRREMDAAGRQLAFMTA